MDTSILIDRYMDDHVRSLGGEPRSARRLTAARPHGRTAAVRVRRINKQMRKAILIRFAGKTKLIVQPL